uniref:CSON002604 protein n=1 Tax=Culicoides sonorensis TaxID=179676 RepID=A0A336L0X8_CULSO
MTLNKPLSEIVIWEIALDGLEGITFLDLCQQIAHKLKTSNPLPTKIRENVWSVIKKSKELRFYCLPVPRQILKIYDRRTLDALMHTKQEKDKVNLEGIVKYKFNPIDVQDERGSCEHYETRVSLQANDLEGMDVDTMLEKYGQALVFVACQKLRNKVLGVQEGDINLQQYCILERIGRSRSLGEFSAGVGTLQDILNTEKKVSGNYIMKGLVAKNLITKQEYRLERENISKLIYHLPEFYTEMKSRIHLLIENAVNFLKNCPSGSAESRDLRESLMTDSNQISRVMKNQDFRDVIERFDLPYRQVYPNASREQWQCKNQTERMLSMVRLKDPNVETYNIFSKKNTSDKDDDETVGQLLDVGNQVYDQSLLRQLYQYMERQGTNGIKQLDIQRYFGLSRLNARGLLRVFERFNLTETFMVDEGRQRLKKWILKKYSKNKNVEPNPTISNANSSQISTLSEKSVITQEEIENDEAILNVTDNIFGFESAGVDVDSIEATLTFMKTCPNMKEETTGIRELLGSNNISHRVLKRCQIMLKLVQLKKVVSSTILVSSIRVTEAKLGYKDQCDKKSCLRLLNRLAVDNYLNIMQLQMMIRDKEVTYLFACDPNLEPDGEEIKMVVDSYKAKQIMRKVYEEEGVKEEMKEAARKLKQARGESVKDKETKKSLQEFTMAPKFIRMRNLHEFLFYYMYGQPNDTEPLDKDQVLAIWNGIYPDMDISSLSNELPLIYSKDLDWRTFVPPHRGDRHGWGILSDIILKMPLSLIFTLINFDLRHPELEKIMLHPVKRFYTVAQAPQSIRALLTYHRMYSYSIYSNAVNLAYIGALQFGLRRSVEKDQVYIYINRNVSVYDTRSTEPSYHKVEEKEYPHRLFYLKTFDDLQNYWSDIYVIAHGTKLNHRLASVGQEILIEQPGSKPDLKKCLDSKSWEEVVANDDGSIPGDHLGACGFDSAIFTHLRQSWIKGRQNRVLPREFAASTDQRRKSLKKYKNQISAAQASSKRKAMIALRVKNRGSGSKLRKVKVNYGKKIRLPNYDEVDKTALKLMNKLRVEWKEEEDQTLLTCKLALLFLNPPAGCGAAFQAIRDILHFKHPASVNKTTKACQRRITYILKFNMDTRSILNFCVEELKSNSDIEKRFGDNFLINLRKIYKFEEDFNIALRIHFAMLVYLLDNCYKNLATNQFQFKNIVLPDTLGEYEDFFNMTRINKYTYVHDPLTIEGIQTMMIDAVIHSSMCCTKDKTTWNFQLFDIYKNYSDELLRKSIKGLRARQVISANKSVMTKRLFTSPISGCPFHLSQNYLNQITTKFSYDSFTEAFNRLLEFGQIAATQGSYDFKLFDIGSTLLFADLSNSELLNVQIELPRCVMQIEKESSSENVASYDRAMAKFGRRLEHFAKNKTEKEFENDSDEEIDGKTKKRVKFDEYETFQYAQAPVERLLKLDYTYFHFFCLLNAIQEKDSQIMSQNFHLYEDQKCSLNCVLAEEDAIEACIKIAGSCKDIIKSLVNSNKKANSIKPETTLKNYQIKEDNLQIFFKKFIEQQKTISKVKWLKIFGKIPKHLEKFESMVDLANDINLQFETKLHFWIKLTHNSFKTKINEKSSSGKPLATSQSILSAKKSNKDVLPQDNVHRYHEMFNINIGKLNVGLKSGLDKTLISFENVEAPKCLLWVSKEKKDELIKKIKSSSIWPIHMRNIIELRITLKAHNLLDYERKLAENVLDQIKDSGEMGIQSPQLAIIFGNTSKKLLQKVINALVAADFVLKTGIRTITYVHWTCVSHWLVKSYNLKRLERESIPLDSLTEIQSVTKTSMEMPSTSQNKRPLETEGDTEFLEGPSLKRQRKDYPETEHISDFVDRENIYLIPQPWIRINGTLNRRSLDKWMGSLLLHILQYPGQYLKEIYNRFAILTPFQIRKLIEFLVELDCVELLFKSSPQVSCFSTVEDDFNVECASDFDDEKDVFVQAKTPAAFTKFSLFIGNKKYSTDFI